MPFSSDKPKILVVDDLPESLLVYRSILEDSGVELVAARSGSEALRHLLQQDFAVILLDVNMPDMDGYETASMIRTRRRCAHTPIIFVTAYADELHALKGYSYGAVDYILSPVNPDVLRTKVRVFADLYRLNQRVRQQAAREVMAAEQEQAHLTALLETATDFVGRVDAESQLLSVNPAGRRMLGHACKDQDEASVDDLGAERLGPRLAEALAVAHVDGIWFGETTLTASDGREIPVSQVVLAHKSPDGATESFSVIAHDITRRKETEAELEAHRARLEVLVKERTADLEASHERLRLADRLASIGTLAAGLGHDMGNLLLPIRVRLSSLEDLDLPEGARAHIEAIKTASEYLRRLSQGLRLFALDPTEPVSGETTSLTLWWSEVEPFLRNALPRSVVLSAEIADAIPPIKVPPHAFTQLIYNLVQNAGDAMSQRGSGNVRIRAFLPDRKGGEVVIEVADDGPGMTEEVRTRCMEPFFTTRTRRISTGLGLALVRGAVVSAGGSIQIQSFPGQGTTFRLTLPVAQARPDAHALATPSEPAGVACVCLKDARLAAYITSLLRERNLSVSREAWSASANSRIVVLDSVNGTWGELEQFLLADEARRALILGSERRQTPASAQIAWLDESPTPSLVRDALLLVLRAVQPAEPSQSGAKTQQELRA